MNFRFTQWDCARQANYIFKRHCFTLGLAVTMDAYYFIFIVGVVFSLCGARKELCSTILFKNVGEDEMPWVQIEGIYTKISTTHDDFPVYKSEKSGLYFYYSFDRAKRTKMLAFGQDRVGENVFGLVASVSVNFEPTLWLSSGDVNRDDIFGDVAENWFYYFPLDKTFKKVYSDRKIKAVCVDDVSIQCDSGKVYFNDTITSGSSVLNDPKTDYFKKLPETYVTVRPVYKHSRQNWYLYYQYGYWRIGTSYIGASTEVFRVTDHAMKPEYVTGVWNFWTGTKWTAAVGMTLLCRGIANGKNFCPLLSLPCKNSGTCVYTKGNETVCVCKKGSYGVYCEETSTCPIPKVPSSSISVTWTGRNPGEITTSFCNTGYRYQPMEFYVCESGKGWLLESKASCQAPPPSRPPTRRAPLTFLPRDIPTTTAPWNPSLDFLIFFGPCLAFHMIVPAFIWLCITLGRIIKGSKSTPAGSSERVERISKISGQRYWVLLRIYSAFFNFMFWPWLVFVFACAVSDFKDDHNNLMYCAMGMCGFCAVFVAAEGYLCVQRAALRNIVTWDYILSLHAAAPVVEIIIERYQLKFVKEYYTNTYGYREYRYRRRELNKKTVREPFVYTTWKDESEKEISLARGLIRVDLELDIKLADEVTENAFKVQEQQLVEKTEHLNPDSKKSRKDNVPNFTPHVLLCSDSGSVRWWMSEKYFWIATLCQLSWVYRAYFNHETGSQDYTLRKTVFFKPDDAAGQTGSEQVNQDRGSSPTGMTSSSGLSENKPLIEFASQGNSSKNYMSV